MKKKGFTLIELLAVIVILAIIALIATPIVMNVIENSRKGAAERSVENLEHSAEIYYYNKKLDGGFPGITFTCKNGSCSSNDETLEISGKTPEVGSVIINKDGTITLSSIVIDGYTCYKEGDSYTCDKVTKETAETTNGFLTLLNSGGKNLVNYKIYGNSAEIAKITKVDLPTEYQQVEYIESTGTQYIDTEIIPDQDTGFDIVFLSKNSLVSSPSDSGASGFGAIMGSRGTGQENEFQITTFRAQNTYKGTLAFGSSSRFNAGMKVNKIINLILKNQSYTNNDDVSYSMEQEFESPVPLTLFALNSNGTVTQHGLVQIYSLKIYDGDTLVRNFIPVYNKNTNISGLYDLVENEFYTNKGTGEFVKGADVTSDITITESVGNYNLTTEQYEIPVKVNGKNLFDVSKVYTESSQTYINNGDGSITVTYYGRAHNASLMDVCPALKPGDEVTLSAVGDGGKYMYLTSGDYWDFNNSKIITGDMLNSRFAFYPKKVDGVIIPATFSNIQIEYGSSVTSYEPYKEETYSIYLDEPLRCVDNACDYIDYISGKLVRNVGVESDGSLVKLEESISQDIDLPNIKLNKGINNIFVDTDITPSNFEVDYY